MADEDVVDAAADDVDDEGGYLDEQFVFEVVERVHDRVLSGIDVIDNVLIAIVAAVSAIIVLAIDELRDFGLQTLVLLFLAMIVCVIGWSWGRIPGYREVPNLSAFIARVAERPDAAIAESIDDFRQAAAHNRRIRSYKVRLAGLAAVLLIAGTLYAGFEKVVQSSHGA